MRRLSINSKLRSALAVALALRRCSGQAPSAKASADILHNGVIAPAWAAGWTVSAASITDHYVKIAWDGFYGGFFVSSVGATVCDCEERATCKVLLVRWLQKM